MDRGRVSARSGPQSCFFNIVRSVAGVCQWVQFDMDTNENPDLADDWILLGLLWHYNLDTALEPKCRDFPGI